MMNKVLRYDAIVVLGGGRISEKNLTDLSRRRLDKGARLILSGIATKIFVLGEYKSTFDTLNQKAILFRKTGARLRKEYLMRRGVKPESIVEIPLGEDTIAEAFASALVSKDLGFKNILLVTSDKHLPRAREIFQETFRRVLKGSKFKIWTSGTPSGDLLDEMQERQALLLTREFFRTLSINAVVVLEDLIDWYKCHKKFYEQLGIIQRPSNTKFSQAYSGLKKKKIKRL